MKGIGWLLASALGLAACSAIVNEIELTCVDECKALNEHHGLGDDACFVFQCRSDNKGCERRARDSDGDGVPDKTTCGDAGVQYDGALDCDDSTRATYPGASEQCNGSDDDCDLAIDEETGAPAPLILEQMEPVSVGTSLETFAYSATSEAGLDVLSHSKVVPGETTWWRQDSPTFVTASNECAAAINAKCRFDELAIASTAAGVVAAGVNTFGCDRGQVRIGASLDRRTFSWSLAPSGELAGGVDLAPTDKNIQCTERAGASRVGIGMLTDPRGSYAFSAWRDVPSARIAASPLVGIGVGVSRDLSAGLVRVDSGSGSKSQRLSDQDGFDKPVIAAWTGTPGGFFLAYDAGDAVELGYVARPGSGGAAFALRHGQPISAHAPRAVVLVLEASARDPEELALAVAWREEEAIAFATLAFLPAREEVLRASSTRRIPAQRLVDGPWLVARREGFRTEAPTGGWYVLWLEQLDDAFSLMAMRVSAADTALIPPAFTVLSGDDKFQAFVWGAAADSLSVGLVTPGPGPDLRIGSLGCR